MSQDEKTFETLAEKTLHDLMEQIDDALGDGMDVDLEGGILHIELEDGGKYVINKQVPNREIWMSSPQSGARHFTFDDQGNCWLDTRNGENFYELLSTELARAAGQSFVLN